ncbi:MAG: hypothetical protein AAF664_23355 [Planctomycetota bacterium]
MTGIHNGDATCTSCGIRLCLGPTPRVVAYSVMAVVALLICLVVWFLGDFTLAMVLLLVVIPIAGVLPLSLWMAFRIRGVIISPRDTSDVGQSEGSS